jgi:flagellar hook-associated protein 3 FlgL
MRVTDTMTCRNLVSNLEMLNEQLDTVNQQISTGKRFVHLRDSPATAAGSVLLQAQAADLDQYKANNDSSSFFLQVADSALNSVQNLVTTIQTKGSEAASGTVNATDRATLASDIRSLRDQVLSLANSEVRGRYIFAGSEVTSPAFTISGDTVTYEGDDEISTNQVGDNLQVQQNVVGSTVFSPIFDSIKALLSAIDGGDQASIQQALGQFSSSLNGLILGRGQVGEELSKTENIRTENDTEEVNLTAQQSRLEDANTAEAATQLSQLQTALKATLAAGQTVLQEQNLFDFLG